MKSTTTIILVPDAFPWHALVGWGAAVAVALTVGTNLLHASSLGGSFVIGALLGNAVFAAMLGGR